MVSGKIASRGFPVSCESTRPFRSAYASILGREPPFTNFKPSFKATLDYIFFDSSHLRVLAVSPLPEKKDLEMEIGLPSSKHGSDHLPIMATIEMV